MARDHVINNFKQIVVTKPVDIIIKQIRDLITSGELKPGDKLPSERKLSEAFNIGRTHVRDAIRKLEFYGILKTLPQSGTVVAGIGMTALEGLISDVLQLEKSDFSSLVETRVVLEIESARQAALRRTDEDLIELKKAIKKYCEKIDNGQEAVDEDMMLHLQIAEASKNKVLKSLMLIIIPDILTNYAELKVCSDDGLIKRSDQHQKLYDAIAAKDADKAAEFMRIHLQDILKLGQEMKE